MRSRILAVFWVALLLSACGSGSSSPGNSTTPPATGGGSPDGRVDDSDDDGVLNANDLCPNSAANAAVDDDGCSDSQRDSDNDNVVDASDQCPNTPETEAADEFGCSVSQRDSDGDGVVDTRDDCADSPDGKAVNSRGCPVEPVPEDNSLDAVLLSHGPTADRCDFIDPHYCLFPFPNDRFTVDDASTATGKRVNFNLLSMPVNSAGKSLDPSEMNRNDGWSVGQMLLAKVDQLNLQQSKAPLITNIKRSLDSDSPIVVIKASTGEQHLIWSEIDANITKYGPCDGPGPAVLVADVTDIDELGDAAQQIQQGCDDQGPAAPDEPGIDPGPALIIRPAINFDEGERYIVALRNLKNSDGEALKAQPEFQVCRDEVGSQLPHVNDRCAALEPLFAELADVGVERRELIMAWDFTVISRTNITERMLHIRDTALADLGDAAPDFTVTRVENYASGTLARRVYGRFTVPCFLNTAGCIAGGSFNYLPGAEGQFGDGLPDQVPQSTQQAGFICNIPRRAFSGSEDPANAVEGNALRPVLYGHGLLGARREVNNGHQYDLGEASGTFSCATDWYGMASGILPDSDGYDPQVDTPPGGDIANVASLLNDMSNFKNLADRVQQGMLAFIFLGKALLHGNGLVSDAAFQSADGDPLIDRDNGLFYDGNSQGGIIGGALLAVSPDIPAGILGVPGMNYSTLLRRSVDFDVYATLFYASYRHSLDQSFVLSAIQMLWDRAESNGYAHTLRAGENLAGVPAKRVILHPGFGDHQVTMWSAEVFARTIGAAVHCPAVIAGSSAQSGNAVANGAHLEVDAEADRYASEQPNGEPHPRRRHPDDEPYFGMQCINYHAIANGQEGYNGNGLVVWDRGPYTFDRDGTTAPPISNTPPRPELGYGEDPHSDPRKDPESIRQKGHFLQTLDSNTGAGFILNVCGSAPCTTREFEPNPNP